uniref:Putative 5'-nucleotidase C-terminal domain-containing protein n=2 Tax=Lotharella globosa TaxID=91324 RepID=A0A7S4DTJ8_9EUKA
MNLDQTLGCNPYPEKLSRHHSQLFDIMLNQVWPYGLKVDVDTYYGVFSRGGLRYDLYPGDVNLDDIVTLTPFHNEFFVANNVPGMMLINIKSQHGFHWHYATSDQALNGNLHYTLFMDGYDRAELMSRLTSQGYSGSASRYDTTLDTTTIWSEFVKAQWSCDQPSSSQDGRSSSAGSETALIAGLAIGFAAVVVGLLLVGYKFAPCMNNNSGQNTELAGMAGGSSMVEGGSVAEPSSIIEQASVVDPENHPRFVIGSNAELGSAEEEEI